MENYLYNWKVLPVRTTSVSMSEAPPLKATIAVPFFSTIKKLIIMRKIQKLNFMAKLNLKKSFLFYNIFYQTVKRTAHEKYYANCLSCYKTNR